MDEKRCFLLLLNTLGGVMDTEGVDGADGADGAVVARKDGFTFSLFILLLSEEISSSMHDDPVDIRNERLDDEEEDLLSIDIFDDSSNSISSSAIIDI